MLRSTHKEADRKSKNRLAATNGGVVQLPLITVRGAVLFPGNIMPVHEVKGLSSSELRSAEQGRLNIIVSTEVENSDGSVRIHPVGTIALITGLLKMPDGSNGIVVRGERRVKVQKITEKRGSRRLAQVSFVHDRSRQMSNKMLATLRGIRNDVHRLSRVDSSIPAELLSLIQHENNPESLCYQIAPYLGFSVEQQLQLLGADSDLVRTKLVTTSLQRELELSRLSDQLQKRAEGEISESERREFLQEQIRAFKDELAEIDGVVSEVERLDEALEKLDLPEGVQAAVDEEFVRLDASTPGSSEYVVSYNYLSLIRDLPWESPQPPQIDLRKAEKILNRSHFGLEKAKEGILEFLAAAKRSNSLKGNVLLLDGPPGVGKTSLVSAIAEAMGRPFVRISLGGMRDESELRGHRRTYIGAMPGRILNAIKSAKTAAPVILLDEIDKLAMDQGRAVEAALLEILDPQQNKEFVDNFLAVPFSLESVFFVATSNDAMRLSSPLLDRMQIVSVSGYSDREKLAIVKKYLVPSIRDEYRLSPHSFRIYDNVVSRIMREYTREAGVRQLKRELERLGRKFVRRLSHKNSKSRTEILAADLPTWLGQPPFPTEELVVHRPGMVNGLAYTENGGEMLPIESCVLPRNLIGQMLRLTGSIGKVMLESAETAWTLVLSQRESFGCGELADLGVHLHFPDSATPKDGPSAGLAIALSILSSITKRVIPRNIAVTGEISLSGAVLPVGGIREKLLAGARNQCSVIYLPEANRGDFAEVLPEDLGAVEVRFVRTIEEVIEQLWPNSHCSVPVVAPGFVASPFYRNEALVPGHV
jgi:ATP-dependent Lon protease